MARTLWTLCASLDWRLNPGRIGRPCACGRASGTHQFRISGKWVCRVCADAFMRDAARRAGEGEPA